MEYFMNKPHKYNPYWPGYDTEEAWRYFRSHPFEVGEWRRRYAPPEAAHYCNECLILRLDCQGGRPCPFCRSENMMCTKSEFGPPIWNPEFDLYGRVPGEPIDTSKFPPPPPPKAWPAPPPAAPAPAPAPALPPALAPAPALRPLAPAPAPGLRPLAPAPGPVAGPSGIAGPSYAVPIQAGIPGHGGRGEFLRAKQWKLPPAEGAPPPGPLPPPPPPPPPPEGEAPGKRKGRGGHNKGKPSPFKMAKCQTCVRRCRGWHKCDMEPGANPPRACTECTRWGLFCVHDGVALPPRDLTEEQDRMEAIGRCDPCMNQIRNCDRKRPCDNCIIHGEPVCSGRNQANCFWRGAPGDNLPLYYEKIYRDGQRGVNYILAGPRPKMPPDYHLQYQPLPPGVDPAGLPFPGMPGPAP
ncbi:uncharacterized protein F4807DRAFT_461723 [Annulohypoxylon truncatum]|uniref:uncharacterized protein n=1 Tax=Annulohypoxylon truncatum TaxID=327061 RepID=UPI0020087050|nr:uncharacterized protein F4807DRAFT_461723 [Annulohypoxylon truncatum]KAI1208395.1 hypothetical protein F4807DRAFT_461723 [Annulohypoxylon truncatum]